MRDVAKAFVDLLRKSPELPDHVRQGILGAGADAVEPLLELLADRSVDAAGHPSGGRARVHASVLLGHLGDRRAVEPLLGALVSDRGTPILVRAHATSLARLGDVAEPTLAKARAAGSHAEKAVLAMVLASSREVRPDITAFLRELLPSDPQLVLPLVERYGDPDLAPDVGKVLLTAGTDAALARQAVRTLGTLGVTHPKLDALGRKAGEKLQAEELADVVAVAERLLAEMLAAEA
jgi:hypothetical protein